VDCLGGISVEEWSTKTTSLISLFSNPTNDNATVKLSSPFNESLNVYLCDITGREISRQIIPPGQQEILINHDNVKPGQYFTILRNKEGLIIGQKPLQKL